MNSLLQLPSSVRIVLFAFLAVASAAVLFSMVYAALCRRNKLYVGYLGALFVTLFIFAVVRTPLTEHQNISAATYVQLWLAVPVVLGVWLFVKTRRPLYLADVVWYLLNLPWWERVMPYYGYVASASLAYMLLRATLIVIDSASIATRYPGRLSIKYALDTTLDGIAFVNRLGQITYVNHSLSQTLRLLGLTSFHRPDYLLDRIAAYPGARKVSDTSCIVEVDDKAYRFVWDSPLSQIGCIDVTEEVKLLGQIERNKALLAQAADQLGEELAAIESMQQQRALLAVKGHLHDNLAQQLSILHMLILMDTSTDLTEVKKMLSSLSLPQPDVQEEVDPDALSQLLAIIGVKMEVVGDLPAKKEHRRFVDKLLKEASTNAVRHGKAMAIRAEISYQDGETKVTVTNDGVAPSEVIHGNGLRSLQADAEALGGRVEVHLSPFAIVATLPD